VGAGLPQTSQHEAGHRSSEAPASTSATASLKPDASAAGPGARGSYTILVASFKSPESGQRVVEELTNAGFRARAVERDGGPERGRFMVVMVSGYTSATDVQRDLQQIRSLPGGYSDARIVENE
jgi:cell division septation protein DedD